MIKRSLAAIVIITVLYSCNNAPAPATSAPVTKAAAKDTAMPVVVNTPAAPVDIKKERAVLEHYMQRMAVPSQHLSAPAGKVSMVRGAHGTIVTITPTDLVTEGGQPVTGPVEVELKELTNPTDFMEENAATVSDGKLLASGGSYYINLTSNGQPLKLKLGKSLKVNFPKNTKDDMSLFYGQRDSSGQMNWKPGNEKFVNFKKGSQDLSAAYEKELSGLSKSGGICIDGMKSGTITKEALQARLGGKGGLQATAQNKTRSERKLDSLISGIYNQVSVEKLGWINCDRFPKETILTNVVYNFDKNDSIVVANAYLVFKDINSIMRDDYGYTPSGHFLNAPVGSKATLVAVAVKKGKVYTSRTEITIAKNQSVTVHMKKSTDKDVHSLFDFSNKG